ncbi:riboflavin biosynthesis protein RibF [Trichococcus ilyis]|uniref:Riboflavin biosynthesis protein n=1 Tax=Trichococcus ilyis TaxID=640938 RepID=A0A143Y722_9LACT|nr:riboflavin biosynthesis protein RibF [Trichococcus ilyis]CZQ81818.1 riboflavin kinase [Trichococcus ilyis]SEI51959.1 riboflavin kinase / FMN adenylyltransferase [Trichococcus ilyis]
MEIIHIHHPYDKNQIPDEQVVLALGYFDGVHRGHQEVIKRAKEVADQKQLKLAVMSFNHHPSIVFQKMNPDTMQYLSTVKRKAEIFESLGVDYFFVIAFTSAFASLRPQDFVDQYISGLHAAAVVAGFDYTYGPREIADMKQLVNYAKDRFEVIEVEELKNAAEKISSTHIREALAEGNMEKANAYLGYVYQIEGTVIHGDARGRLLGFPTANIQTEKHTRLPRNGVYIVSIKVNGTWYRGTASIGHNITFEADRDKTVEVYILDFNKMIYGEDVIVRWHHFIRSEIKFSGVEQLIAQLKKDEAETIAYFQDHRLNEVSI